jgi:hypothetical protein
MGRLHAPNEFLRIRRLRERMRAWEELWRLLADGPAPAREPGGRRWLRRFVNVTDMSVTQNTSSEVTKGMRRSENSTQPSWASSPAQWHPSPAP